MPKLIEYLKGNPKEDSGSKKKAMMKLKLALLVKKVKASKNTDVKSAFAEHLGKAK